MTDKSSDDDFYQDDEDLADVLAAFERGVKRVTEPLRRELAQRHKGEVVEGSGRPVRRKPLASIHSVRFSHDEAKELGQLAERMDMRGLSDLLRAGARLLAEPVGFRCDHAEVSCAGGFTSFAGGCGCQMQPVYRMPIMARESS